MSPRRRRVSVCPVCGRTFPSPTDRKYCGAACREAAHDERQRLLRRGPPPPLALEMTAKEIAEFINNLPPFDPDGDFTLPDEEEENHHDRIRDRPDALRRGCTDGQ